MQGFTNLARSFLLSRPIQYGGKSCALLKSRLVRKDDTGTHKAGSFDSVVDEEELQLSGLGLPKKKRLLTIFSYNIFSFEKYVTRQGALCFKKVLKSKFQPSACPG